MSTHTTSLLPILLQADNLPAYTSPFPTVYPLAKRPIVPFHITFKDFQHGLPPVGLVTMDVVKMLSKEKGIKLFQIAREVIRCSQAGKEGNCKAYPDGNCGKKEQGGGKMKKTFKLTVKFLYFTDEVNARGKKGRTECIARILSDWRAEGKLPQAMKLWMDEMFPIYASPKSSMFNASKPATRELFGNIAFEMERAGVSLFGCQAFGVHLTVRYAYEGQGENMKSVAGGLPAGHTPIQGLIKECGSINDQHRNAEGHKTTRSAGIVTYFEIKDEHILPNAEYTYDLPLPCRDSSDYVLPKPNDDEVDSFELLSVQQLIKALRNGEFKPSSAIVTVDFLIRHGFVSPENEPNYEEVVRRCHRRCGASGPGI
ncbi:hypothetical protein C361_02051 [Cryptococcus neoformans Tu259-1]|uniref:Nudix hydrolase domain-containing protein n=1 Tax=Cryptococcus neoformans Tu259-1 TaxID=1230072 RepID=A0A854QFR4_CRYNE|nr:hypothetical protein C353_01902 [Cryptococcus neoformans var. grubii AD1-83a]OXG25050.1 hypothetical protein C361_02051 [Cryptococcus neoformans var. grubii Tu259-1]OXG48567.1 hypothetical protein C354_06100 [Cryptococcus neoformans var. grubii MW-RSA1955]OXG52155.1 hypothetical protein C352_06102 [Cryptococcus neoformans var. grubii CHC193]OXG58226.1 hypothetical protein C351_06176 [Cryptococcus neoformans var. grubii c8]OXH14922.1 hypothetical protein C369_01876 [Cryptococcus neoformans v